MTHSPVRSHTRSGKSTPRSDGPEARAPKAPAIATALPADPPVVATIRPEAFRWSSVDLGPELPMSVFTSTERWNPERIGAVAIYCSDGRWGESFDEFCHKHLQIPRYDRLALAGGPACFAPKDEKAKRLCEAALEQLAFVVKAHELKRIVLITHYGCAVYAEQLQRQPDDCLPTQMDDLRTVAETLRRRFESVKVETYLASVRPEIGTAWKISGFFSESSNEDCRYEFYNRARIWDFQGIEPRSSRRISHAKALQSATSTGLPAHRTGQTESELSRRNHSHSAGVAAYLQQ